MDLDLKNAPTLREIADRSWMERASCRGVDTEAWFDPKPPKPVRRHVERVCSTCLMTRLCLSYGLVNNQEFGAWGGYVGDDLLPLRRRFAAGEALGALLNSGIQETGLTQDSVAA